MKELLEGLNSAPQDLGEIVIEGKAISRSKDEIHVAIQHGVASIPIKQITHFQFTVKEENLVRIFVTQANDIRLIRSLEPILPASLNNFWMNPNPPLGTWSPSGPPSVSTWTGPIPPRADDINIPSSQDD